MTTMQLNEHEQAMLRGDHGQAVQEALQVQIEVGSFFEADKWAAQDTRLPAELILSSQTWEEDGSWVK